VGRGLSLYPPHADPLDSARQAVCTAWFTDTDTDTDLQI
jgi:hypothetical protein